MTRGSKCLIAFLYYVHASSPTWSAQVRLNVTPAAAGADAFVLLSINHIQLHSKSARNNFSDVSEAHVSASAATLIL